nr:RNA-directed DNA polymerase, eukaryota [Tanacetum cinerariifolium]
MLSRRDDLPYRTFLQECNDHGIVVDTFIPYEKSKASKRFAFVRFIKVDNIDRLEMEASDNDSYESESSDDEEDSEDDMSQSGDKVTADNDVERRKVSGYELKYPHGFTPSVINVEEVNKKVKWATSNEEPTFFAKDNITSSDNFLVVMAAQKSKVRWAIEGDENTKFFHAILNSKRSQIATHGTLVDGEWIVDLLSLEQQVDLERNVSNEEIKSAVWDCGTNKSPGPDGFTFEFFRRGGAEEEKLSFLLSRIDGLILTNIPDRWVWSLEATSVFFIKSVRQLIDDSILSKEEVATRWVKVMPIKINVFVWRVHLDKLPTRLNLSFKRKLKCWWELEDIDLASSNDWINSSRLSKRLKESLEALFGWRILVTSSECLASPLDLSQMVFLWCVSWYVDVVSGSGMCIGSGWGRARVGAGKTLSRTKSGLLELFIVSKWNWKMCVVPCSCCRHNGRAKGFLSSSSATTSLTFLVSVWAWSLKHVIGVVVDPSLTIALKQ